MLRWHHSTESDVPSFDAIRIKFFWKTHLLRREEEISAKATLHGHCGMRCDACAMHTGEMKAAISKLKELMGLYEIVRVAQLLNGIEGLPQFLKTLDKLETMFGECAGCEAGGGWPDCPMRRCCLKKHLGSCYECETMPCQELVGFQRRHLLSPAPHYRK